MIVRRFFTPPTWAWRSPFDELERMRRELNQFFEDTSSESPWEPPTGVYPLANITEDQDSYYVRAELPGLKAPEIDISITSNSLSISGERKIPAENEKARYHRREREAGTFRRMIKLPIEIDTAKVEARSVDGVLTVILPKAEATKPRQIAVKPS